MVLPSFVGVGVQRAASTWVHECLREHPDVFVPEAKEVHYFDRHFDRGRDWYEYQFREHGGRKAVGEITPDYLANERAVAELATLLPAARLFVVLREPVERAYSAYRFFTGYYEGKTFAEAVAGCKILVPHGLYADQMERLYRHFPRPQVKVFLYDDVTADPARVMRELYEHVGVAPGFRPQALTKVFNGTVFPKAQKVMKRLHLNWAVDRVKGTALGAWIKRRRSVVRTAAVAERVDDQCLGRLKEYYRADVVRLQSVIGRDLSGWL